MVANKQPILMKTVKCRICEKEYKQITGSHVENIHGMTLREYKNKFPQAVIARYEEEEKERVSQATAEAMKRPEVQDKLQNKLSRYQVEYWTERGLSEEEAREKISELQRKTHENRDPDSYVSHWSVDYWTDRGYSEEEARKKISELQAENSAKSSKFEGCTRSEESKRKISQSMREHVLDVGKEEWAKHAFGDGFGSELENEVASWVKSNVDPDAVQNENVGSYVVDILSGDRSKVIEVFGDFWHCHENMFCDEDVHPIIEDTAAEIRERDSKRLSDLNDLCDGVLVVWEHEWRKCKQKITSYIQAFYED